MPSVVSLAIAGLLGALVLALIAAMIVRNALNQEAASRDAVVTSHERVDQLEYIFSLLQDVELGQRGYVITGDESFLAPYLAAVAQMPGALSKLHNMPGHEQRNAIGTIESLIQSKLRVSATGIETRREKGAEAAIRLVQSGRGKRLMDEFRAALGQAVFAERQQLKRRIAMQSERALWSERVVYLTLVLAVLLVLGTGTALLWHLGRRKEAEIRARETAGLLRATLENVGHGIVLLDEDARLVAWNAQFPRLLNSERLREGMVIGDAIASRPEWGNSTEEAIAVHSREPLLIERDSPEEDGCIEVRGQPAPDGMYVVTYTDISERRRTERLKNDFVSNVSHELRTPLTSIRGALGLMMGPLSSGLSERVLSLAQIADRNAVRLLGLVNDLLDIDKIESGRMEFTFASVDLNQVALEAAENNRGYAAQRGVTLALGREQLPIMVNADFGRLQQVMANLISNAAKFSPTGSIVTITVERHDHHAMVTVRDQGPGVPDSFRSRIFGKFAQAASGDQRTTGGSGLGLSISRAIVERHGGRIGFTSVPADTRFSFSLPLAGAAEHAQAEAA